jgi:hypothetical protein
MTALRAMSAANETVFAIQRKIDQRKAEEAAKITKAAEKTMSEQAQIFRLI